jgi:hypothetical protein
LVFLFECETLLPTNARLPVKSQTLMAFYIKKECKYRGIFFKYKLFLKNNLRIISPQRVGVSL